MADLVRVFASETGFTIGDESFAIGTPPDVIVEVEASAQEFTDGDNYRVSGFARDVETGKVAKLGPINGLVGDPSWPTRNHEFTFALPASIITAAAEDGIVELVASVRVGGAIAGADADIDTGKFTWVAP